MAKSWGVIGMLLLPMAAGMLAGCASCESGPPVTARGILSGASAGGTGPFTMDILVTDGPGGPPLAGAGVVVYWSGATAREWDGPLVEVEGGAGGGRVVVDPGALEQRSVEPDSVVRLFTGSDGMARASVPSGRIVGIVSAKDGFTEEWVPALATGDSGSAGYSLPLFRQNLTLDVERVWPAPGSGSPGVVTSGNYAWDPAPIPFGDSPEAIRGYGARVVEMSVTVTWENGAMGYGELGVGLGPDAGTGPTWFRNGGNQVAPGQQSDSASISLDELVQHDLLGAAAIHVGAATESAVAAPFGLPYQIHVEARFDRAMAERASKCGSGGANDNESNVPGFEAIAALGALVGVALVADVARRRMGK